MRIRFVAVLLIVIAVSAGCFSAQQTRRSSNLMSYIYPDAAQAPQLNLGGARLQLPLRVGVAFVPTVQERWGREASVLAADTEKRLVEVVQRAFRGKDWVSDVVMIPSTYLMPGGGFQNLDQVSKIFGTDVVALVSIDQLQRSDPNRLSFLYLSIIGAYVLPLDENDTRTLIDAAVFHVPTRTLLLRAPGQNVIEGRSTGSEVNRKLAENATKSLELAMVDLAKNLDVEVETFKQRVVSGERTDVEVVNKSGESIRQSGSMGYAEALVALLLAIALVPRRR